MTQVRWKDERKAGNKEEVGRWKKKIKGKRGENGDDRRKLEEGKEKNWKRECLVGEQWMVEKMRSLYRKMRKLG